MGQLGPWKGLEGHAKWYGLHSGGWGVTTGAGRAGHQHSSTKCRPSGVQHAAHWSLLEEGEESRTTSIPSFLPVLGTYCVPGPLLGPGDKMPWPHGPDALVQETDNKDGNEQTSGRCFQAVVGAGKNQPLISFLPGTLPVLQIPYQWNRRTRELLCLAGFCFASGLLGLLCSSVSQAFIPFRG